MPAFKNLDHEKANKAMKAWDKYFNQPRVINNPNKDPYACALLGELPSGFKWNRNGEVIKEAKPK